MYEGMPLGQLEVAEKIPQGSSFPLVMGDGSGTKKVTQETMVKEMGKSLKVGNLEELQTENKSSIVEAINEAAKSGGSSSVDILDTKEEIEANTEAGKTAGAIAVKEMFTELNDNLANGQISFEVINGEPYVKVGADTPRPFKANPTISSPNKATYTITINGRYVITVLGNNANKPTLSINGNLVSGSGEIFQQMYSTYSNTYKLDLSKNDVLTTHHYILNVVKV